jgi:hypothetical protein
MGTWTNKDGLYIKYGTDQGVSAHDAGEYTTFGPERVVEVICDLSLLTATETILNDVVTIPSGSYITKIETIAIVGAATGTAIDVGLIKASDRSTEIDYNGLLAAAPTANMNSAGERSVYKIGATEPTGLTGTGALVGTATAFAGMISASRTDATAFTAGTIRILVSFIPNAV